jgi:hypothetical protein
MTADKLYFRFPVSYGQGYLDDDFDESPDWGDFFYAGGLGILGVHTGHAIMLTGLHTGRVGLHVQIGDTDPGAELDDYEDIVEADFYARTAQLRLRPWGGIPLPLPPLPNGAGQHRLRYHARGMDKGQAAGAFPSDGEVVDECLLQIWPAEPAGERTLKVTSVQARLWQQPKRPGGWPA